MLLVLSLRLQRQNSAYAIATRLHTLGGGNHLIKSVPYADDDTFRFSSSFYTVRFYLAILASRPNIRVIRVIRGSLLLSNLCPALSIRLPDVALAKAGWSLSKILFPSSAIHSK